ncbi:SAM-dependent methyltransferase [Streptomyces sp. NPDC102476]|uniref:SAM-dependent methyltransferase n=1 Tax=Streptomyces sp. NPDC102476 TaxID=3366181 RepID=UPI0037FD331D
MLSHPAADIGAEAVAASMGVSNERAAEHAGATPRSHADVTRFFDGTELLEPGVVQLPEWRPDAESGPGALPMWCGVGRKPL